MTKNRRRGKRLDGCGWIYGSLLQNEDMSVIVVEFEEATYCGGIADCPYTHGVIGFEVDPETVGQYTGLKDKNGKKIYEGDLYHQGDKEILYVVVWKDTSLKGKQVKASSYAGLSFWQERIEIIGNIHDNPELLEVET